MGGILEGFDLFWNLQGFLFADDDIVETISPQMLQSLFASGVGSGCLNKPFAQGILEF